MCKVNLKFQLLLFSPFSDSDALLELEASELFLGLSLEPSESEPLEDPEEEADPEPDSNWVNVFRRLSGLLDLEVPDPRFLPDFLLFLAAAMRIRRISSIFFVLFEPLRELFTLALKCLLSFLLIDSLSSFIKS